MDAMCNFNSKAAIEDESVIILKSTTVNKFKFRLRSSYFFVYIFVTLHSSHNDADQSNVIKKGIKTSTMRYQYSTDMSNKRILLNLCIEEQQVKRWLRRDLVPYDPLIRITGSTIHSVRSSY